MKSALEMRTIHAVLSVQRAAHARTASQYIESAARTASATVAVTHLVPPPVEKVIHCNTGKMCDGASPEWGGVIDDNRYGGTTCVEPQLSDCVLVGYCIGFGFQPDQTEPDRN